MNPRRVSFSCYYDIRIQRQAMYMWGSPATKTNKSNIKTYIKHYYVALMCVLCVVYYFYMFLLYHNIWLFIKT